MRWFSLTLQDHHCRNTGGTVHMAVRVPDLTCYLARAACAAQLDYVLVHLPQARGADRFAAGKAATVSVDRQSAVQPRAPLGKPLLLIAVYAEAVLGHMHDLGAGLGVLQLCNVDLLRADARRLKCGTACNRAHRATALQIQV